MRVDVRSVANFVLGIARDTDVKVSNLAINKIVYFIYVEHLFAYQEPLTDAKIEAWEHGPVFRELYSAFKRFGDLPIADFATKIDPVTGESVVCEFESDKVNIAFLEAVARQLLQHSASKLRNLSHLPGSPWDKVWNHDQTINAGMEITDEIIFSSSSRSWRN